ncbi:Bug1p LALA0_S03e04478g [Lachancea lanzarotensis]|uniref:LALA0S03e04478g1_1 n=1 Tax=Lachancea lanzarotensis TaxID=1245769 RepID=A0A0C7N815_9SACH|nr:uncharacterized protein LALA0_S03e04478g [Lachancea lanzarotensis]CEP61510.1 LALA0S03e04478g1_1 [Lachancea lanzarotensis]
MSEDDEKRTKQLEEARKRVEELKNRRKKKDQKKKKVEPAESSNETEEKTPEAVESKLADAESASNVESGQKTESNTTELKVESEDAAPEVESEDAIPEVRPEVEPEVESNAAPQTNALDSESFKNNLDSTVAQEKSVQETATTEENRGSNESKQEDPAEKEPQVPQHGSVPDETSSLFPEETTSFLSELQRENDRIALIDLQTQVTTLTAEVRKLKFVNMEQETTIEELQEQVHELEAQLSASQLELSREKQNNAGYQATGGPQDYLEPTKQPSFAPVIDRTVLDKWRGWNVDMTQWRSIGSGPVVHL